MLGVVARACLRDDEFVERIGDFTAPISANHVYMYIHQTRSGESLIENGI